MRLPQFIFEGIPGRGLRMGQVDRVTGNTTRRVQNKRLGKYQRLILLPITRRRRAMVRLASRALRDEGGGEVLEYALVAGLVVIGSIGAIQCVGAKVLARWNSVSNSI